MFVSELKFSETKLQYVWETKLFSFKTSNLTRNNLRNCGYKIKGKEKKHLSQFSANKKFIAWLVKKNTTEHFLKNW